MVYIKIKIKRSRIKTQLWNSITVSDNKDEYIGIT
jgi:hypothetical protein